MKFKVYLRKEDFYKNGDSELWENNQYDLLPFICEIDVKDLNNFISTTINKNGVYFNIRMHTISEPFVAMARHIETLDLNEEETSYEDYPICPICCEKIYEAYELDDEDTMKCPECGAELEISRDVEITYTTKVIKKPKIMKVK